MVEGALGVLERVLSLLPLAEVRTDLGLPGLT